MKKSFKILTIFGSPHDKNSNTRALVADFVENIENEGVPIEHEMISLGKKEIKPCIGCWNCTKQKPCPLSDDHLYYIKEAMINCDMLIFASPVYTNQVTAQMKSLIDRLFTWCHIFPLLGKYSMTACTTGGEGMEPVKDYLQKILATYGTFSLGHIETKGGLTPGFFPTREKAKNKYKPLANKVANIIKHNKKIGISTLQKKMFKVMKRKMSGVNMFRHMADSEDKADVKPPALLFWFFKKIIKMKNIKEEDIIKISKIMSFEYNWWKNCGWLRATSFSDLMKISFPDNFDVKKELLVH